MYKYTITLKNKKDVEQIVDLKPISGSIRPHDKKSLKAFNSFLE